MKLFRRRLRPESRPSFTTHCREVVFLFAKKHPEGIPLSTSLQLVNGVAAATLKFRSKISLQKTSIRIRNLSPT